MSVMCEVSTCTVKRVVRRLKTDGYIDVRVTQTAGKAKGSSIGYLNIYSITEKLGKLLSLE